MPNETPTVVIVGRPNVGKSTLFNRITGQRRSIVGDEPGITRDRISGCATHEGRRFELIDTGGIVVSDAEYIPSQILKQARVALEHASPRHLSGRRPRRDHRFRPRTGADAAQARQARFPRRQQGRHQQERKPDHRFLFPRHQGCFPGLLRARHRAWRRCSITSPRFSRTGTGDNGAAQHASKSPSSAAPMSANRRLLNALIGEERSIVSPDRRNYARCRG